MPGRAIPFVTNEIYHVFNRGIDRRPTFLSKTALARSIELITYYRFIKPPLSFTHFQRLPTQRRGEFFQHLTMKNQKHVDILAFCFMPNHFHFLLRQLTDQGISTFMSNFQNSYTRYFNIRYERVGPLFLNQFKGVRMETDEQLIHVSRYIHLNPLTGYVVKEFSDLLHYPWSSLSEYLENNGSLSEKQTVLRFFKTNKSYETFLKDQVEYQRELHKIKHLLLEE